MNLNGDGWNHLANKKTNYLHSFKTKSKLGLHKKICKNKDFGNVLMP